MARWWRNCSRRSDWKQWTVRWKQDFTPTGVAIILVNVIDKDNKVVGGYFFVRRAKLDKHYPTSAVTGEAAEARVETATDDAPQRRRPGTKPKYPLWRLDAAVFIHRFSRKEKRMPSAGEVAGLLQTKCDGWEPDEGDIRELLRFLVRE